MLMIFLTPLLFTIGFYLSRVINIDYSNSSPFITQCEEALHRCITFIKDSQNLFLGLKILITFLLVGLFLATSKRAFYYVKGYWILKKSNPIDLSLYPKLKVLLQKVKEKSEYNRKIDVYLRNSEGPYIGVFGILHPKILISENLINSLEEKELEAVLLHEIGHLKFMDNFWSIILGAVKDLFFFFVPFRFLHSAYEEEKEYAVDKWVRDIQGDPIPLAYALIKVSGKMELETTSSSLSLVPEGSYLSKRIKNLLEKDDRKKDNLFTKGLFIALILMIGASFTLGFKEGNGYTKKIKEMKCITSSVNITVLEESFNCVLCKDDCE